MFRESKIFNFKQPKWLNKYDLSISDYSPNSLINFVNDLAKRNILERTGGPFGAAIFDITNSKIVGIGVNLSTSISSIFHAEIVAILNAQKTLKVTSLSQTQNTYILVSSSMPCSMCLGAIFWSGISCIVSGASRQDVLNLGFDEGPDCNIQEECRKRNVTLIENINRKECMETLNLYKQLNGVIYNK